MVRERIGLIILLTVPLMLTGCSLKKSSSPGIATSKITSAEKKSQGNQANERSINETYANVDQALVANSVAVNLAKAEEKVKAWHSNAQLYSVSVKLPSNLAVGQATEVYTFGSVDDVYNWWTLNISTKTDKSVRAIIPKEDFLGTNLSPIPRQHWKMNYVEAFQLAEANGGTEFRALHPDSTISVNLAVGQPNNYLWWSVEYDSGNAQSKKILVNPSTKQVNPVQAD